MAATFPHIWVVVNTTTNRIYVADELGSGNLVIDGETNTVVVTIPIGRHARAVAVNPTTNRIYTANGVSGDVSVVDGETNTVVATIQIGGDGEAVAVNPITNRIYSANGLSGDVSVIDGETNTVVATVPVGSYALAVAANPMTHRVYVAKQDDLLSIIEDPDTDGDGRTDDVDDCPTVYNPDQANSDGGRRPNGVEVQGDWGAALLPTDLATRAIQTMTMTVFPTAARMTLRAPTRLLVGDSDGDGALDGYETAQGKDPCNAAAKPPLQCLGRHGRRWLHRLGRARGLQHLRLD